MNEVPESRELIGGAWLAKHYSLEMVASLPVVSEIGGRRQTVHTPTVMREIHQSQARPHPSLRGHLTYHLKHEVPHLELLSRLFELVNSGELEDWVKDEPTGQYARRSGFLYEWLTGKLLRIEASQIGGNYVEALDAQKLVVASSAELNKRWRVADNMPGTRYFCPIIRRTPETATQMEFDCQANILDLENEFGQAALIKSAVWLSMRESRASFQIEGEADKRDRISRFADVIDRRTGQGQIPLDSATLAGLQAEILGPNRSIKRLGVRSSPVFIGQVLHYREVVHYVAPPAEDLDLMLAGLRTFLERTQGASPIMRAAVASFGFVYIHPMADGNGRAHRFLINDILRRDGAVPSPFIIPISGLITRSSNERMGYDHILDRFSGPFMQRYSAACVFHPDLNVYEDGVRSNFSFQAVDAARPAWRFIDMTPHVEYMGDVVRRSITEEMRQEAHYLRCHDRARAAIKDVIEMPDVQIDRLIRSIQNSPGQGPSNAILKQLPILAHQHLWEDVCSAVQDSFVPNSAADESAELVRQEFPRSR